MSSCIMGERLIGYARQFIPFPENKPIFSINTQGVKLDSRGAKSSCIVDKKLRISKIGDSEKESIKKAIKIFLTDSYKDKISIFEERSQHIEGSLIICECKHYDQSKKKVTGWTGSHSTGAALFYSKCAIAYVDKLFSKVGTFSIIPNR